MIVAGPWLKDISSTAIIIIYTTSATNGFSKPHLKWLYKKSAIVLKILAIIVLQNLDYSEFAKPWLQLCKPSTANRFSKRWPKWLGKYWARKGFSTPQPEMGCKNLGHSGWLQWPCPEMGSKNLGWCGCANT
jgi:hypothetical protein